MRGFSNSMSISGLVGRVMFGSSQIVDGSKKFRQVSSVVSRINDLTGGVGDEIIDIRRADTAIPMLSALSTSMSGTDKSVFSMNTYKGAWTMATGVASQLQVANPKYLEMIKRFV